MLEDLAKIYKANEDALTREGISKEIGQYLTPIPIAEYMSCHVNSQNESELRILDAGAGAGILSISAALRSLKKGSKRIHIVLYENDSAVLPQLKSNIQRLKRHFKSNDASLTYEIRNEDFIISRPDRRGEKFHLSVINPPYFKYNTKRSIYADATADIFKGNPNIYASFMALVASCLHPNGQMIAIIPRSFTNGLYFKGFRKYLNNNLNLRKIHIFKSRNKVFKNRSVLQENIICDYFKSQQEKTITINTSIGYEDINESSGNIYNSDFIIDKSTDHEIIRIPESRDDATILETIESWSNLFSARYFISTGPVVEHRSKMYISKKFIKNKSTPLLRMHNIKKLNIEWTGEHKKDAVIKLYKKYEKLVIKNKPYVIMKRFTSRDESRKLVACVNDPTKFKVSNIALENHLNYIGKPNDDLCIDEAYGLAALLNSTIMDKYFRCLSGNTQVNATEIRLLKLPTQHIITKIGKSIQSIDNPDQEKIDDLINKHID